MFKVLVTGDREWSDIQSIGNALIAAMKALAVNDPSEVLVIHGACRGADLLADAAARHLGMRTEPNPAHWRHSDSCSPNCREVVGRAAGVIRNQKMLDKHPDTTLALVFHPDLTQSRGTKNMVGKLDKAGVPYWHYTS